MTRAHMRTPNDTAQTDSIVLKTTEAALNLAKRFEVLIKTRQFVIVRLKGRERVVL